MPIIPVIQAASQKTALETADRTNASTDKGWPWESLVGVVKSAINAAMQAETSHAHARGHPLASMPPVIPIIVKLELVTNASNAAIAVQVSHTHGGRVTLAKREIPIIPNIKAANQKTAPMALDMP